MLSLQTAPFLYDTMFRNNTAPFGGAVATLELNEYAIASGTNLGMPSLCSPSCTEDNSNTAGYQTADGLATGATTPRLPSLLSVGAPAHWTNLTSERSAGSGARAGVPRDAASLRQLGGVSGADL